MLDLYFEKITPNNKKEIQEACDSVIPPINYDNLEKVLRDLDRGIGPIKPIVPFVTNPPSVVVGESVRTIPVENTVYCSNAN
jgi:hypothetical protein